MLSHVGTLLAELHLQVGDLKLRAENCPHRLLTTPRFVILSDVPVRLGPKDLSYLYNVFRICEVGAPPSREPGARDDVAMLNVALDSCGFDGARNMC